MRTIWMLAGTAGLIAVAAAVGYAQMKPEATPPLMGAAAKRAWDFNLVAIDGEPLPLAKFKGQVVLLVNSASKCGYTPQYEGLQKIHLTYLPRGFTVLAVISWGRNSVATRKSPPSARRSSASNSLWRRRGMLSAHKRSHSIAGRPPCWEPTRPRVGISTNI